MDNISKREKEKIQKENEIINAAEELFCLNGFENTSMNDLAKKVEYTKRTIYKYFTCKEDLFFAVLLKSYTNMVNSISSSINVNSTGFEKIKSFYHSFNNFSSENQNLVKLMSMIGIAKHKNEETDMPYKTKFYEFNKKLFSEIYKLFEKGKADKSISENYETSKLVFSSIFTMTGFFLMLSTCGDSFTDSFNLDRNDFVEFTIDLLTNSFKN